MIQQHNTSQQASELISIFNLPEEMIQELIETNQNELIRHMHEVAIMLSNIGNHCKTDRYISDIILSYPTIDQLAHLISKENHITITTYAQVARNLNGAESKTAKEFLPDVVKEAMQHLHTEAASTSLSNTHYNSQEESEAQLLGDNADS